MDAKEDTALDVSCLFSPVKNDPMNPFHSIAGEEDSFHTVAADVFSKPPVASIKDTSDFSSEISREVEEPFNLNTSVSTSADHFNQVNTADQYWKHEGPFESETQNADDGYSGNGGYQGPSEEQLGLDGIEDVAENRYGVEDLSVKDGVVNLNGAAQQYFGSNTMHEPSQETYDDCNTLSQQFLNADENDQAMFNENSTSSHTELSVEDNYQQSTMHSLADNATGHEDLQEQYSVPSQQYDYPDTNCQENYNGLSTSSHTELSVEDTLQESSMQSLADNTTGHEDLQEQYSVPSQQYNDSDTSYQETFNANSTSSHAELSVEDNYQQSTIHPFANDTTGHENLQKQFSVPSQQYNDSDTNCQENFNGISTDSHAELSVENSYQESTIHPLANDPAGHEDLQEQLGEVAIQYEIDPQAVNINSNLQDTEPYDKNVQEGFGVDPVGIVDRSAVELESKCDIGKGEDIPINHSEWIGRWSKKGFDEATTSELASDFLYDSPQPINIYANFENCSVENMEKLCKLGCWRQAELCSDEILLQQELHVDEYLKVTLGAIQALFAQQKFTKAIKICATLGDLDQPKYTKPLSGTEHVSLVPMKLRLMRALLPRHLENSDECIQQLKTLIFRLRQECTDKPEALPKLVADDTIRQEWIDSVEISIVNSFVMAKKFGLAIRVCKKLIVDLSHREPPSDPLRLPSQIARILFQMGNIAAGTGILLNIEKKVDDPESHGKIQFNRGLMHIANDEYEQAKQSFEKVLTLMCDSTGDDFEDGDLMYCAANNFAIASLYCQDISNAIQCLEKHLQRDPTRFLHDVFVFNLTTLYDLGFDELRSKKRKKVLQEIARLYHVEYLNPSYLAG